MTAVGGTALGVGAANTRVVETGWGTSNYNCNTTTLACTRTGWLYGSGGGVSRLFPEPSYQTSAGLSFSGRAIPDVAALCGFRRFSGLQFLPKARHLLREGTVSCDAVGKFLLLNEFGPGR